mmetsp:Transcript_21908/g.31922  ORF Transcript_21908/g.31922 Transcript_21908/m.31922 type:complete len:259 (+) Transcript_21908:71-847(+)|eukprot:CAMPEP_0185024968 /NCGR_PEP_ID=MMETSP1103-20130426/8112_1 /TAXON_ID=36769 /ORGANISM="Paraphysomonas bandaiensis, Strain Caron Lab Isolate" /LENGTH=258 /DNA_ID=CAMNT_0027558069 /DNA_START=50 /DNA_END=826 /DNA_ORIENTATION=-
MTLEYAAEELPLPSFVEVFGDGVLSNPMRKKKKTSGGPKIDMNGEETTGRWTPDEHRLFLEGIMLYGKDWKKMQPLIKTRSLVQIRTHAQKVFKKIGLKKLAGPKRKEILGKRSLSGDNEELGGLDDAELERIGIAIDGDQMLANMTAQQHQQQQQQMNLHHHHHQQQQHEAPDQRVQQVPQYYTHTNKNDLQGADQTAPRHHHTSGPIHHQQQQQHDDTLQTLRLDPPNGMVPTSMHSHQPQAGRPFGDDTGHSSHV